VQYATADGTATAPGDYAAASGTLTFAPGVTTQPVSVSIVPDSTAESTETFTIVLSNPANATIADGTGVGTIVDDDGGAVTATFQIASGADDVNEDGTSFAAGDSSLWLGTGASATASYTGLRFTGVSIPAGVTIVSAHLDVTGASTQWNSIAFDFAAEAVADSAAFSSSAPPSQRTLLAPIVSHASNAQWLANTWYSLDDITPLVQGVVNQGGWSAGHALSLILHGTGGAWGRKFAQGFEASPAQAPRLVVTYNSTPPPPPTLSINDVSVTEGTGGTTTATFTVTLSSASGQTVTVQYATADGTATAPGDYTAGSGTLTFAPGVTTQTLAVPIVTDAAIEPNETFTVALSNPTNATIADGSGTGTIVDDDTPVLPALSINDVSVTEGTGGTTTATFTVTLSSASSQTVTVSYATADGTATAPGDYAAASGTLTFAPGVTTQTIGVSIVTDAIAEQSETFSVLLSNPANATIADGAGVGTVADDDGPTTATFQIAAGADDVNEDGSGFDASGSSLWLGSGASATASYTGLRFTGVTVPQGATIVSAHLEVYAASTQWNSIAFDFAAEAAGDSAAFSSSSRPSQRALLAPRVSHASNAQWLVSTWYALEDMTTLVQAVVDRSDWSAGSALTLVLHGTGGAWGRKFAHGFEANPAEAPRLVITYSAGQ